MKLFYTLLFGFLFCIYSISLAQIPQQISYQGVLTDAGGNNLNGSYELQFSLYSTNTGGLALWIETQTVNINNGVFDVILGAVSPINLPFDSEYWLELSVSGQTPLPRVILVPSAYSLISKSVENNSITSEKIANGTILGEDINSMGATDGQVLAWAGEWVPQNISGIIEETDPVFTGSPAASITLDDINNWNNYANNLDSEIAARIAADADLQDAINNEANARVSGHAWMYNYINENINFEMNERYNADLQIISDYQNSDVQIIANYQAEDDVLQQEINNETAARQSQDDWLYSYYEDNFNSEATIRYNTDQQIYVDYQLADADLQASLDAEVAARLGAGYLTSFEETDPIFTGSPAASITLDDINNWNNYTNNLDSEIAARIAADADLQDEINNEITTRQTQHDWMYNYVNTNLAEETDARINADQQVISDYQTADNQIISDYMAADTYYYNLLQSAIDNEATTRQAQHDRIYNYINDNINNEMSARINADEQITIDYQNSDNSIVANYQASDAILQSMILDESTNRQLEDNQIITNYQAADEANYIQLENADNQIITNYIAADLAYYTQLQSEIDDEATTRQLADEILQANINTEIDDRTAGDANLQSEIDNLILNNGNDGNLNLEIAAREAGDADLQTNLNSEISARLGAGYLTSYTETDPVFLSSPAGTITNADILNWNTGGGVGNSQWITNGSNIYFNTGNVGIGVTDPIQKLDVNGSVNISENNSYRIGNNIILQVNGEFNLAVGVGALNSNTSGYANTATGESTLFSNTTGHANVALGNYALYSNTTGMANTSSGYNSLYSNTTGYNNTANGFNALYENTTGYDNTATGAMALYINTTGNENTATGYYSLLANTTGFENTATGSSSLSSNTTGSENTATGYSSLNSNTTGNFNTANGVFTLSSNINGNDNTAFGNNALYSNISGSYNTATGVQTLSSNTTGFDNTATGTGALYSNTTGVANTATGRQSLIYNTTGNNNTANGSFALFNNTTGNYNTANGSFALFNNTTGYNNVAVGNGALYSNNIGTYNTAIGDSALYNITNFTQGNTAIGFRALYSNTTSNHNTAVGYDALHNTTTGFWNSAIGVDALYSNTTGEHNTAIGMYSFMWTTTQNNNTGLGKSSGDFYTSENSTFLGRLSYPTISGFTNMIAIGYDAHTSASNQVRVGNTSITSIGGYQDWTNLSDGRYKKNIIEDVKGLEFIMNLRPVTYNLDITGLADFLKEDWDRDKDGNYTKQQPDATTLESRARKESIRQSGFIAQEVEAAAQKIGYDFSGVDTPKNENDLYGLRYSEFVVPLVKAVQEQQKQIEEQKKINEDLLKRIEKLEALNNSHK